MSTIKSLKKDELLLVAEELGLDIPQNPKLIEVKIDSSEIFETDKEFLQSVIDGVLAEKNAKIKQEKLKLESEKATKIVQEKLNLESEKAKIEFEKIKLEQLKRELELTNARCKLSPAQAKTDDSFYVPGPIDCLLGADIFYELLRSGQIRSENSNLIFQNTVFGFVASGSNSFANTEARVHWRFKSDLRTKLFRLKLCFSDNSSETDIESSIGEDKPNKPAKMSEKKIRFAPLPLPTSTRATRGGRQVRLPVRYQCEIHFCYSISLGGVCGDILQKQYFHNGEG
ncbi:hypothetical protein TNIN_206321 [Trichonephila inaurata madagascariensis]|uniref:Peptidase aspartic putative domain-containing protein n=1 Tax=Trichonephila inaurata madagascariensis TaxID=2747483 RepID=A0A8X6XGP9_9ARAC|nr:hypothetical protein TNIN_206321 [Trichonephila inaurata madagascariensis]